MKKKNLKKEPCSDCSGKLEKRYISQDFEREGITVKLAGIAALVCCYCGEIYFQPGGAQKVVEAANSIFGLATVERQHKHQLTAQICSEYLCRLAVCEQFTAKELLRYPSNSS